MNSDKFNAYIVSVTEFDHGMSRPDGHIVCFDVEEGKKFAIAKQGYVYKDADVRSEISGQFKRCLLSPIGIETVQKFNGLVWSNDIIKHVMIIE
jgi:hypothetical protein